MAVAAGGDAINICSMLDQLKSLLFSDEAGASASDGPDLQLSVAALLVEAASMDQAFTDDERETIEALLVARFGIDADAARELIATASARLSESAQYHPYADRISKELTIDERAQIIEMMWSVAFADGELDPHEDMLLRQVAGLLHVPDRDRGLARRRALESRQNG